VKLTDALKSTGVFGFLKNWGKEVLAISVVTTSQIQITAIDHDRERCNTASILLDEQPSFVVELLR
jgi:hypothetical protein